MARKKLIVDGNSLTLNQIEFFRKENPFVSLSKESIKKVIKARRLIDKWVDEGKVIYGVTTGFGEFANVRISKKDIEKLQENLIISHSTGVGDPLPPFIVKLMMLLRINALASGHSGIRLETLELLISMMNNNIIPVIPSQGSVGSSGDLAPLSHLVLAMIGKGEVQIYKDVMNEDQHKVKIIKSSVALKKFGLTPVKLAAKEGLALINGTQMMTAFASYICIEAIKLEKIADIAGALSHEALRGTDNAFDSRLHKLRPFPGQIAVAKNILAMIKGSEIRESHREDDPRVQDSYSIRCMPQIHGASRDTIDYICSRIETEINSVNDNPLIFPDDEAHLEGGNFHGQPIALAMDFMAIALSEYANASERRTERMLNGSLSSLPRFLAKNGGLNSGLMIAQYTAASLVSENKVLSHPASVDSIPTSANQEDHNSMGSISARKCFQILKNVQAVLAIEILTSCQALEFHKPLKPGKGTMVGYQLVRKISKPIDSDVILYVEIEKVSQLIKEERFLNTIQGKVNLL
ncbi:MAG: histidine ammonia-lyase [Ignavibacterium sp.]|nr:histidine ammonia-lyase [Ignavibacterium sp.]